MFKPVFFFFKKKIHISIGLPGPLRPAFELKNDLPTSIFQPDAATLTLNALNLLKRPKISKYVFELLQSFEKHKNSKSGGLVLGMFFLPLSVPM